MEMQLERNLPKNFRQIGGVEKSTKVYIEDYVYTFMKKSCGEGETVIGALIGNNVIREGVECSFISGMVKAADFVCSDGKIIISDNTWAAVFENVKRYFDGMTVCGWFVSSGSLKTAPPSISGIQNCSSMDNQLIFVRDRESEEDYLYRLTNQGKTKLSGYYIYYERNEQMQNYMIAESGAKSVDPPPVNIMKRLEEKKEADAGKEEPNVPAADNKKGGGMIYAAAVLVICSFIFLGYSYYGSRNVPVKEIPVVAQISDIFSKEKPEAAEKTTASSEELIVETAPGIVSKSVEEESLEEKSTQEALSETLVNAVSETMTPETAAESEAAAVPVSESIAEVVPETAAELVAEPPAETEVNAPVNAQAGSVYTVKPGDTLTSICVSAYGVEDKVKIEEIRNLNGLESADYIFVGQVLNMP